MGGTDNTVPMEEAPQAVLDAREFIHHRLRRAVDIDLNFNEILR